MSDARTVLDNATSEQGFQNQIIELAQTCGFLVHHTRPAQNRRGQWSTPIQGDAGFPDLTLCHEGRGLVLFLECKTVKGKTTAKQDRWLIALGRTAVHVNDHVGQVTMLATVVRPADWEWLEPLLRGEM